MIKRISCVLLLFLLLGCSNNSRKEPGEEVTPTGTAPVMAEPVVSPKPSETLPGTEDDPELVMPSKEPGEEGDVLPSEMPDLKLSLEEAFDIVHEVTAAKSCVRVERYSVPMEIYKINCISKSQVAVITMYYDGMDSTNKYYYFALGNLLIDGDRRHLDLFNEYAVNGDTGEMIEKYETNGVFSEINPAWP